MASWPHAFIKALDHADPTLLPQALLERLWGILEPTKLLRGLWIRCHRGHLQPAGLATIGIVPGTSEDLSDQLTQDEQAFNSAEGPVMGRLVKDGNVPIATLLATHEPGHEQEARGTLALISRQLLDRLRLQLESSELVEENRNLRDSLTPRVQQGDIITVSGKMERLIQAAMRTAASNATVLIQGDTGTGKELMAQLIHAHSPRSDKALISVNAGALSSSLLESELFGHRRGAFTGADRDRQGLFEVADGGTLFLDEIGELSMGAQVRLLRALQERTIHRVGDHKPIKVDVRVIAATHRDLEAEVAAGRFRQDLLYRLNVVTLQIPPLRERPEDIPILVNHFIQRFNAENYKSVDTISPEMLQAMQAYHWPGNIRELENCIQKAVIMSPSNRLDADFLPATIRSHLDHRSAPTSGDLAMAMPTGSVLEILEQAVARYADELGPDIHRFTLSAEEMLITWALNKERGVKLRASRILGINRVTLDRKLAEYGLTVKRGQGIVSGDDIKQAG